MAMTIFVPTVLFGPHNIIAIRTCCFIVPGGYNKKKPDKPTKKTSTNYTEILRKANEQNPFNFSSLSSKVLAQTALPVCYTGDFIAFSSQ